RSVADNARTIRIPVHMIELVGKLNTLTKQIFQKSGIEPSIEELSEKTGLPVAEVKRVLKVGRNPTSLDKPVGDSEDAFLGDFLEDQSAPPPPALASTDTLKQQIDHVLKTLTYREREIIKLRYGIGDGYTYTLEEVGRIFKVTRERVRQVEAKALRKLQHPVRSRRLAGFLDGKAIVEYKPHVPAEETAKAAVKVTKPGRAWPAGPSQPIESRELDALQPAALGGRSINEDEESFVEPSLGE
ncbi:MAG: sigma-70 family RNA polymerase sigma factor, partial [Phycisphaerales bacterium]